MSLFSYLTYHTCLELPLSLSYLAVKELFNATLGLGCLFVIVMSPMHSEPPTTCCATAASTELKLYQAFIFSVPIFFTFVLLFLFYLFYLRRRRVDWSSLRMRATLDSNNDLSTAELGLKKEVREMLPIIIFKESFSVRDTQCSVCLGDYQADDKLQQIPKCGHAFHMGCIDHWLAIHSTCPLCRLSLLACAKPSPETPDSTDESETGHETSAADTDTSLQHQNYEETQEPNSRNDDLQHDTEEDERSSQYGDHEREAGNETEKHSCGVSANGNLPFTSCDKFIENLHLSTSTHSIIHSGHG